MAVAKRTLKFVSNDHFLLLNETLVHEEKKDEPNISLGNKA